MAFGKKKKDASRRGLGKEEERFLHLKEFSHGKPNELSFNVLEQKAAAQGEKGRKRRFPNPFGGLGSSKESDASASGLGAVQVESAPGRHDSTPAGGGASFMGPDSQAEIEQRQRRRRWSRRISVAVVVLLCVGLLGAGGYWAYQQYVKLSTSVGVLKEACSLIEQSDQTVVAIDAYFQTGFGDDTVKNANDLVKQIPDARKKLEKAKEYAEQAHGELEGSQHDREAAEHALNAIAARETLLDVSEQRLADDVAAKQAIDAMDEAWSSIEEGNSLLAQAAQVISDTTEENVGTSTTYTTQAQSKFAEARSAIEKAAEFYPEADVKAALAYVDKRSKATSEALASNAAILIQDKKTAESHNDAYNKADAEAVEMAKSLPSRFAQPIVDAYVAHSESLLASYDAARADAATNDSFLRDYLGTE